MHVCIRVCVYVYMCMCVCVHVYVYMDMCAHGIVAISLMHFRCTCDVLDVDTNEDLKFLLAELRI